MFLTLCLTEPCFFLSCGPILPVGSLHLCRRHHPLLPFMRFVPVAPLGISSGPHEFLLGSILKGACSTLILEVKCAAVSFAWVRNGLGAGMSKDGSGPAHTLFLLGHMLFYATLAQELLLHSGKSLLMGLRGLNGMPGIESTHNLTSCTVFLAPGICYLYSFVY